MINRFSDFASTIYRRIPESYREKFGREAYEAFLSARRRMLRGEIKTFEGSGYLEYLQIGNSLDKPTLLFLHGFADSKDSFYELLNILFSHSNRRKIE